MIDTSERKERFIGVVVSTGQDAVDPARSLEELADLVDTAGGELVYSVIQNMSSPSSATYVGSGKVEELRLLIEANEADGIVCDDELAPAQMANLERALQTKVLDRTMVILDIFAAHATTKEGKIQVEMAQLAYRSSRLAGSFGTSMSRLGGGIGTRGPGETKLETDRRAIRNRMSRLRAQIKDMEKNRQITRKARQRNMLPTVAIVGYTNAGKSTLLNKLTGSEVLEEDQLFATLDPTTRALVMEEGQKVLLTDTVGFIHKLPHHLIDAFRSTLEEARYADIILHVVDAADPDLDMHMDVVYQTLQQLEITGKPVITVFNKQDLVPADAIRPLDRRADVTVRLSAARGFGIPDLLQAIQTILKDFRKEIAQVIPYSQGALLARIHEQGQVIKEEYRPEGVYIEANIPKNLPLV
ncbi:GTP-binding protein HflX [Lachnospiraceae bacterium KHCPX20]|nr:GTP-binding protein HflX [Lachnospiraceae bacterium KHCPX20]